MESSSLAIGGATNAAAPVRAAEADIQIVPKLLPEQLAIGINLRIRESRSAIHG